MIRQPAPPSHGAPAAVRVLTVDDQAVFRRIADDVIAATEGLEPVSEVAELALRVVRR